MNREWESRLISILRPRRWLLILLSCEKRQFASYTSNLLEQMYDFQKRTIFTRKWILNLQYLLRSQSLETIPVCIVWQHYTHDNVVCSHKYDEYMKSVDSSICHKLWSILWWIVRAYLLTIKNRVVQFFPGISISEQFESMYLKILQQILFNFFEVMVNQFMEKILCGVVESSCFLTHNIAPRISSHDLPYPKTMKKYEEFEGMEIFSTPPTEIHDSNMALYLSTISLLISHCLWKHPKFTWSRQDVESPKSTTLLSTIHIGSRFFFPVNLMSSTHTEKNIPFTVDE